MQKSTHHEKFLELRKKHPVFTYENFSFSLSPSGLDIEFVFSTDGLDPFRPKLFIPRKAWFRPDDEIRNFLPGIIFQIGMIELISYWKATCSPRVRVVPGGLTPEQIAWWKGVWFNGLGEFFYLNSIGTSLQEFMSLEPERGDALPAAAFPGGEGIIVPVGGGKDSVVTLELLRNLPGTIPMIMNPRGATLQTIYQGGYADADYIEIHRKLDPGLLRLNSQGYLNGHTPFSALLAFVSVLAAILSGRKYIALSNESSASETTIPGTAINHQYSKSLEFEEAFRWYSEKYVARGVDYFSFLRPLNELQIARIFSGYKNYHPVFRSCNAGSREDTWCGKCAKCLFTCIILSPFLSDEQIRNIFGKNLLDDPELRPLFDQLTGVADEKPFDCVGTLAEVNLALCETIRRQDNGKLPCLLEYYRSLPLYGKYCGEDFQQALAGFSDPHHLPGFLVPRLKSALHG
jgi:hypothetical protein